jgi:hypothetical protein
MIVVARRKRVTDSTTTLVDVSTPQPSLLLTTDQHGDTRPNLLALFRVIRLRRTTSQSRRHLLLIILFHGGTPSFGREIRDLGGKKHGPRVSQIPDHGKNRMTFSSMFGSADSRYKDWPTWLGREASTCTGPRHMLSRGLAATSSGD